MSTLFVFAIILAVCLCYVAAGTTILDAETAIQKIIAAYNRIPGRSIIYLPEIATLIDPNTFVPHF